MPIKVRCSCGKTYNIADKLAGKKFRCKSCDKILSIARPAPRAKAKTANGDDDSGFLDMDLDAEFSQMAAVEQPRMEETEEESPFLDPRTRRDPRVADLNKTDAEPAAKYVPQPSTAERTGKALLALTGIVLGVGLLVGMGMLWKQGVRWRGLGGLGIILIIGGVRMLADGD